MLNSAQNAIAEDFAVRTLCSDTGNYTYPQLLDMLDSGQTPDGVLIWEPFEHYSAERLANILEGFYDTFSHFTVNVISAA